MLLLPQRIIERLAFCPNTGCWLWDARWDSGNGYRKTRWQGRTWMAHRLVWTLMEGPIPEGHVLDHLCRVRFCCNPGHMEPVTMRENTRRGEAVLFTPVSGLAVRTRRLVIA